MEMKNSCRSRWWWGLNPVWFLLKALSSLQSPCLPSFPSLFPVLVDPCMVCFPQHHCTICLPSLSVLVPGATVAMAANTFIKQPTRGWLLGGYCCFSFYVPKMHSFSVTDTLCISSSPSYSTHSLDCIRNPVIPVLQLEQQSQLGGSGALHFHM